MISGINFLGQITPNYNRDTKEQRVTKPIECDCFVRSKKTPDNDFIKWANDTGFLKYGLKESLSADNFLGKGFNNSVFKIKGNDDYVLRVRNSCSGDFDTGFSDYTIKDKQDKNLKGNFGQTVALISSSDYHKPQIEVLMKQQGITNCNPPPSAIYHEDGTLRADEAPYEATERKEHYAKCLEILANMPQGAYDKLVSELTEIGDAGYKFDYYNPNNFLLDEENESINIIDLEKSSQGYKNDLGNALWALSNIEYLRTYISSSDKNPVSEDEIKMAIENTISVIDKYTKALQNNGKKYSREGYEFTTQLLGSTPMAFYLRAMSDEDKRAKLNQMGVLD